VHIKELTNLKSLNLSQTKVADEGLEHLQGLAKLQTLYLRSTQVTDAGIAELKKALPKCQIRK